MIAILRKFMKVCIRRSTRCLRRQGRVTGMFQLCLFGRRGLPDEGGDAHYISSPLRSCSTPYTNQNDLETGTGRTIKPSLKRTYQKQHSDLMTVRFFYLCEGRLRGPRPSWRKARDTCRLPGFRAAMPRPEGMALPSQGARCAVFDRSGRYRALFSSRFRNHM